MQIETFIFITWLKCNHVSVVRAWCSSSRLWERLTKLHFNGATNYQIERRIEKQCLRFLQKKYFVYFLFYWFDFRTISRQNLLNTNFLKNYNYIFTIKSRDYKLHSPVRQQYFIISLSSLHSRRFYNKLFCLCRLIQHLYYCTMAYEMIQLATWKSRKTS